MKLAPDNKTVIRVPIKREFTREQVGDKTLVELSDQENEMQIKCPQCKLEFNKPIITEERKELFAGDLFDKAHRQLLASPLSKEMEKICDNVIIVQNKTPAQFIREEYERKGLPITSFDFKDIKVVDAKPEKIKEEDIDPDTKTDTAYNIMYGRAGRSHDKSAHFSEQA